MERVRLLGWGCHSVVECLPNLGISTFRAESVFIACSLWQLMILLMIMNLSEALGPIPGNKGKRKESDYCQYTIFIELVNLKISEGLKRRNRGNKGRTQIVKYYWLQENESCG